MIRHRFKTLTKHLSIVVSPPKQSTTRSPSGPTPSTLKRETVRYTLQMDHVVRRTAIRYVTPTARSTQVVVVR
jgi:hypothetical protein